MKVLHVSLVVETLQAVQTDRWTDRHADRQIQLKLLHVPIRVPGWYEILPLSTKQF